MKRNKNKLVFWIRWEEISFFNQKKHNSFFQTYQY